MKQRCGPNGVHLFDRKTGWNLLLDELRPPAHRWSRAPAFVSIALTNACDLECAHCYAPKYRAQVKFDDVLCWASELDENGCLGIGFGGGEPTLYPRFDELCDALSNRTSLAISFTTHGHHLNPERIARLARSCSYVRVSMDGTGSIYESIRGRPFAVLLDMIRQIGARMPYGINFGVNETTFSSLDEAAEIAISTGVRQLLLLPEIRDGRPAIGENLRHRLTDWVRRNSERVSLAVSVMGAELLDVPQIRPSDGGIRFAHIDASSTLKRCAFDMVGVQLSQRRSICSALGVLGLHPTGPYSESEASHESLE
jgi:MoaA/NifB/PqqE/SkfB family radical SAM enzyme